MKVARIVPSVMRPGQLSNSSAATFKMKMPLVLSWHGIVEPRSTVARFEAEWEKLLNELRARMYGQPLPPAQPTIRDALHGGTDWRAPPTSEEEWVERRARWLKVAGRRAP